MFVSGAAAATVVACAAIAFCGAVIITVVTIVDRYGNAGE
jgi:hypothetical protein